MSEQITESPAEVYERLFVPALFAQWAGVVASRAGIRSGQRVLDVACGTGVLSRAMADRVGDAGSVVGLDPNEEMLAVARRTSATIDWKNGKAESLPFQDESFDAVVSQFGLMFFENRRAGLSEAMRVLRPGGHLVVAVCDALDHSPGYAVFAEMLHRLFGEQVAQAFRAPFACGSRTGLLSLCAEAGLADARVSRCDGMVQFASIESLVSTERACAWTLGGLLNDSQFEQLREAAEESLRPFVTADGTLSFVMPALILTASRQP